MVLLFMINKKLHSILYRLYFVIAMCIIIFFHYLPRFVLPFYMIIKVGRLFCTSRPVNYIMFIRKKDMCVCLFIHARTGEKGKRINIPIFWSLHS